MFARTPKAVEFRKWVLKVLGAAADNKLSGNSEQLPIAQVDMKAIGSMVKRCASAGIRDGIITAVKESLSEIFEPDILKNRNVF